MLQDVCFIDFNEV